MRFSTPYKIYSALVTLWLLFLISGALFIWVYPFQEYIRCWGDPYVLNANVIATLFVLVVYFSTQLFTILLLIGIISSTLSIKLKDYSFTGKPLILLALIGLLSSYLMRHSEVLNVKTSPNPFVSLQGRHCDSDGKPHPTWY